MAKGTEVLAERRQARLVALVDELCSQSAETEWVEFKHNIHDVDVVGQRVSALSNSARLHEQHYGYLVWGIEDGTHRVVGTQFDPDTTKHKGQPYKFALAQFLDPFPALEYHVVDHPSGRVVLLQIPAANELPVAFRTPNTTA